MTQTGHNPLGKQTAYPTRYDPELLFAIPRRPARESLDLAEPPPFSGVDIWNAYELSWLLPNGCPQVATAQIVIDAHSQCLVESKSLKLYLNSLNNAKFDGTRTVEKLVENDLQSLVLGAVSVSVSEDPTDPIDHAQPDSQCLDQLAPDISTFEVDATLLRLDERQHVDESRHTNLFRSLCPITGQPDWAAVTVAYAGPGIEPESLLRYLVSYHDHGGYHEQCVEQIFADIQRQCDPESLCVDARFLRRGGLDINPVRSAGRPPTTYRPAWRQ